MVTDGIQHILVVNAKFLADHIRPDRCMPERLVILQQVIGQVALQDYQPLALRGPVLAVVMEQSGELRLVRVGAILLGQLPSRLHNPYGMLPALSRKLSADSLHQLFTFHTDGSPPCNPTPNR
ncbi:hypothetical protein D3C73_1417980 [compost metagenome]